MKSYIFIERSYRASGSECWRIAEHVNGVKAVGQWVDTVRESIDESAERYAAKVGGVYCGMAMDAVEMEAA